MQSKVSSFLLNAKPVLKDLVNKLSEKYEYVSVLGTDTLGSVYTVYRNSSSVSDTGWKERGFVVRVFNGINYSEFSFNEIKDINYIINMVDEIASEDLKYAENSGILPFDYPLIHEDEVNLEYHSEFDKDPFSVSSSAKIKMMSEIMNEGIKSNENFVDFRVIYEEVLISKIFISNQKDLSQSILYTVLSMMPFARYNNQVKYNFESISGLKGLEIFDEAKTRIKVAVENVVTLLDAKTVKPGVYDIICDPAVSGLIAHEAFGHGVEMDMFVKKRAKGEEFIGKEIASDKVNMRDGAKSALEVGTYLFDDEGTLGTDTLVIDNAILNSGISDLLSALKLGTTPTGNGRRESFERKAYARMTNTFFEAGSDTLEDMIASIEYGYLLEGYFSGMEDPKNWGIQCIIAKGREIKDGKLTGNIISPVLLTGYVPDLLKSISMVSKSDLELSGSGACGKGYKEFVKTSTGGTYIKAVGRLG